MIKFKIYVVGKNEVTGFDADSTVEMTVATEDLKLYFGKAMYSIETQGFKFNTSDVYEEVVPTFDIKLKNTYQKVFSKDTDFGKIEVSIKEV